MYISDFFCTFAAEIISAPIAKNMNTDHTSKEVSLQIKPFAELTAGEMYEILKARFNVFYLEQQIRYPDLDDVDYVCTHVSLWAGKQVIAYARLFADAEEETLRVGRMLTVARGQGFGRQLMENIIAEARCQGARRLFLHAQTHAVPFYERFGFTPVGEMFMEADIPHLGMELSL